MDAPAWLIQDLADVPCGEDWLGERERRVLEDLRLERRRASWRLGRWTAKRALGRWLAASPDRIEILAAADGAPEAWIYGERAPVSISISHRGDRGLAVVARAPLVAGCDLELIEPRSAAFVREWLAPVEQELIASYEGLERDLLVNLIWTAKEAAAKVHREGLRCNVRQAIVSVSTGDSSTDDWCPLQVRWPVGEHSTTGWWRAQDEWVMSVVGEPPPAPPRAL